MNLFNLKNHLMVIFLWNFYAFWYSQKLLNLLSVSEEDLVNHVNIVSYIFSYFEQDL